MTSFADLVRTTTLEPRPYQERIVNRLVKGYCEDGMRSMLVESPTGSGKTLMALLACRIMQTLQPDLGRIGWVAQRRNLLAQAQQENETCNIGADVEFVSMMTRNPPTGLKMIVVDECQHDAADSMVHIHNINKPKYVLGMTATPFRTDNVKLYFDTVIKDATIGQLIVDGYLSRYDHYTIPVWDSQAVAECYIADAKRWGKSLIFFHTLEQCSRCAAALRSAGVRVEMVTGGSNREAQLQAFEDGEIDVIVNCMVLAEGFDSSSLKTVFCRPSCKGVTIQMAGRVLRKHGPTPVKQIVQCKGTKWPFMRTAAPAAQYLLVDDGSWRALHANENVNKVYCRLLRTLAGIKVEMPKYITGHAAAKRRRRPGVQR